MKLLCLSSRFFVFLKRRLLFIFTHSLLFVAAHTPPTLSLCRPRARRCAETHTFTLRNSCTHTHTQAQIYFQWHLALDRCSHCFLYLQPFKWVFLVTYDSSRNMSAESPLALKIHRCVGAGSVPISVWGALTNFGFWRSSAIPGL